MTDSAIKYVGVDGCPAGWIGVGLDDGDGAEIKVCGKFGDLLTHYFKDACVVLVDMPIGLPEDGAPVYRGCDNDARELLKKKRRESSVFHVPSRRFVDEVMDNPDWGYRNATMNHRERYNKANGRSKELNDGSGISPYTFGIIPNIYEVDEYLTSCVADSPKIRESHPEVCFWALNGGKPDSSMTTSKKTDSGFKERIETLRHCARNVNDIDVDAAYAKARREYTKSQVADNDILDALALAITAKIGCRQGEFKTLPENPPTDSKGLPMEMVYAIP